MNALMWPTMPPTTMSTPFIEMPQRERGIALDHQKAAVAPGAGGLRGVAVDPDRARHDVLGDARPALPWT